MKKISETKCTCQACGNIWHYGKQEEFENTGKAMHNLGKSMMCCTGCAPAVFIPNQKVKDLGKCPKCNSQSIKKEKVTYEIE